MSRDKNPLQDAQEALLNAAMSVAVAREYCWYTDAEKHAIMVSIHDGICEQLQKLQAMSAV